MKIRNYAFITIIINVTFIYFLQYIQIIGPIENSPLLNNWQSFLVNKNTLHYNITNIEITNTTFLELKEIRRCILNHRGITDIHCLTRHMHGDLIRKLHNQGASLIVFNLLFRESRSEEDLYFAESIRDVGNVLLQDYQQKRFIGSGVEIVDITPPVSPLGESSASAPMPIADIESSRPHFWRFLNLVHSDQSLTQSYSQPILPVTALQLLMLRQHQQTLIQLFQPLSPALSSILSVPERDLNQRSLLHDFHQQLSQLFTENPNAGKQLTRLLNSRNDVSPVAKQRIQALFRLYQVDNDFYLNPYGPSHTIPTIAYHQVDQALQDNPELFRDKAVFIGPSVEFGRSTKGGTINTAYGEISSTELLATLYANLRDGNTLQLANNEITWVIAVVWWLLILAIQTKLSPRRTVLTIFVLTLVYLGCVQWLFSVYNLLVPWLLIVLMSLTACIVTLIGRYFSQRAKLSDILNVHLPAELLSVFTRQDFEKMRHGASYNGVCLITDAEGYTKLAESKGEAWLAQFMLGFQPVVEQCVRQHQGAIKGWAGDGVMALWIESPAKQSKFKTPPQSADSVDIRRLSLLAALSLINEVEQFNQSWGVRFPLRIGLSYGPMWLSFVDELKAFGDTINTASRIEALNKNTHTRILITQDMLTNQSEFVTRRIGRFVLRGHQQPTDVYELLGLANDIEHRILRLLVHFEQGLNQYENKAWRSAQVIFSTILSEFPNDGPSLYYYQQCLRQI
jgi:adenylate cyclase